MRTGRLRVAVPLLAAALLAACADATPVASGPIEVQAADKGFELTLSVADATVRAGDPIDVHAALTWTGPQPTKQLWAAAQGPILFSATQVDGRWQLGPASDAACATYVLQQGVPDTHGFEKALGWSNDDPDAAFYRAYAQDPLLRLPAGHWRLTAEVDAFLASCEAGAPRLQLKAVADVVVE